MVNYIWDFERKYVPEEISNTRENLIINISYFPSFEFAYFGYVFVCLR